MKAHLMAKYEKNLIIMEEINLPSVICFWDTGDKILSDSWYQIEKFNSKQERLRVVEETAAVILEISFYRPNIYIISYSFIYIISYISI